MSGLMARAVRYTLATIIATLAGQCAAVTVAHAVVGEAQPGFRSSGADIRALSRVRGVVLTDAGSLTNGASISVGTFRARAGRLGLAAVKRDSRGRFERAFGKRGIAKVTAPVRYDALAGARVLIAPDGSLAVVVTDTCDRATACVTMTRLTSGGRIDGAFGMRGWVHEQLSVEAVESVADAALAPDGAIVLAGSSGQLESAEFAQGVVARYTASGSIDAIFGVGGSVVSSGDTFASIAVDVTGGVTVAGARSGDSLVFRYLANGVIDPSFGIGGSITADVAGGPRDGASSVQLLPDRSVVAIANVEGDEYGTGDSVFRVSSTGAFNTDFSAKNRATRNREADLLDLAVQSDGKVVAVGSVPGLPRRVGNDNSDAVELSDHAFITRISQSGEIDSGFGGESGHTRAIGAFRSALGWYSSIATGQYRAIVNTSRGLLALGPSLIGLTRHANSSALDSSIVFPRNGETFRIADRERVSNRFRFTGLIDGPVPLSVKVAIARVAGNGRCTWLESRRGSINSGAKRSCGDPLWIRAESTSERTWRVNPRPLPAGSYRMFSRAVSGTSSERRHLIDDRTLVRFKVP